jgi:hypothetical protein
MFTLISKKSRKTTVNSAVLTFVLALGLTACGDNDNDTVVEEPTPAPAPVPADYTYNITVTNLTYAQPLSPLAVALHAEGTMWAIGTEASVALEKLAEGGDNTDFLAQAVVLASSSDEAPIGPGASSTISITTNDRTATHFTSTTMLVNTNDAFSGLTGVDISEMALNDSMSWHLNVYDAGTEGNSEVAGSIPGPADGGTGYDEARDDVNFVALHSGVVSQHDGLSDSVLTQSHRFDNPAITLTITRTE